MSHVVKWIVVGAGILAGLCLAAVMFVMTIEVFFRYVMRQPSYWSLEVSTYLLVAAVSLGGAYTLRMNAHVGVEIVYNKLPALLKRFAFILAMLSVLVFASVLVWYGIKEVQVALRFRDRSLTPLAMPMAYPMSLIPIGGLLLAIQAIELLFSPRISERSAPATVGASTTGDDLE